MERAWSTVLIYFRNGVERKFTNAYTRLSPMETVLYVIVEGRGTRAYSMHLVEWWSY